MNELTFRILSAALFAGMLAVAVPHRHRAEKVGGRVSRKGEGTLIMFGLRLAGALVWLTILAYMVFPRVTFWGTLPLPSGLRLLGVPMGLAALAWFFWVFRSLGLNVTDTVAVRERARLVTIGPYRWVRHPLYAAVPLVVLSYSLLAANWFVLVVGAVVLGFLIVRTRIEERNLVARFGEEYVTYMVRTGRFFPRLMSL